MIHGITLGNVNYQLEINSTYDTVYPETYPAGRGSFELIDLCLLAANRRSPVLPARTSRETAAAPSRIEDCRPSLAPQAYSLRDCAEALQKAACALVAHEWPRGCKKRPTAALVEMEAELWH